MSDDLILGIGIALFLVALILAGVIIWRTR